MNKTPEQLQEVKRIFDLVTEGKKIIAKGKVISVKPNLKYPTTNYTVATEKGLMAWFATTKQDFYSVRKFDYVEVEFTISGKKEGSDGAFFVFGKRPTLIKRISGQVNVNP